MAAVVSWTDLLPELCGLVADRMDAFSALRFPTACKTWSAAYKEAPPGPRSGAPTMLTSGVDDDVGDYTVYDYEDGVFALRDVSTGKRFRAEVEGARGRCWVGGKDDWLVTADADCGVELFNPVNGVEGTTYAHSLQRVALAQTPVHRDGYLAVAMFSSDLLAFTRSGDESWTPLKNPVAHDEQQIAYADTIVHGSRVVAVTHTGDVYSWDINNKTTDNPTVLRQPDTLFGLSVQHKLATSSGGDRILLVCLYGERTFEDRPVRRKIYDTQHGSFVNPFGIVLYELVEDDNEWRSVPDIGSDRALFLGANYPFYIAVPPRSSESKDLEANCIYVADMNGADAIVIDLKKGGGDSIVRSLVCSPEDDGNLRNLDYSGEPDPFQVPMWFRPTACLLTLQ